jgi:hypothetical protein
MLNSTTSLMSEGFGGWIRPLEIERRYGRLMRAPEHDGAGAGDGAGADDAGAAGAGDGAGDGAAADSQAAGEAGAGGDNAAAGDGAADGAGDEGSIVGSAGTGDAKDGDAGEGDGDGEGKEDKPSAVPETYELQPIKIGEGDNAVEVTIDNELLTEVTPELKEAGVTAEQAQKLAPLAMKIEQKVVAKLTDDFNAQKADWARSAKADPEIGGKNWDATNEAVAKALDHFGAPSEMKEVDGKTVETNPFRVFLNQTGFGNHPELIRMFAKIGAQVAEDGALPRGDKGATMKKSSAEVLYPNDVPKGA